MAASCRSGVRAALTALTWAALLAPAAGVRAQSAEPQPDPTPGWRECARIGDGAARLACYDRWAAGNARPAPAPAAAAREAVPPAPQVPPGRPHNEPQETPALAARDCRDPRHGQMSRFWELEQATDCGTFRLRGYRPLSLSVVAADTVNAQPGSPAGGREAGVAVDYRTSEMRVQLSVRTKLATGLLPRRDPQTKDSLWFGYTQQSYWQLFSPHISRPFRTTDHEPELVYVYPLDLARSPGWHWRFAGLGLAHHSNGQSLPLSRSWNRVYLMAGGELDERWSLQARLWQRLRERGDADDNPGIERFVGRAELRLAWQAHPKHTIGLTLRHALQAGGKGSARLEWLRALGEGADGRRSNLRLHAQLFSGYGDSLVDYNFERRVFLLGLSLLDF